MVPLRIRLQCLLVLLLARLQLGLANRTREASRLSLFASFSAPALSSVPAAATNGSSANRTLDAVLAALNAANDFVLIGDLTLGRSVAQLQLAEEGYGSTDSETILYQRERWTLVQEGSFHEAAAPDDDSSDAASACLGVAEWNASWNDGDAGESAAKQVAALLAYVGAICKPREIAALAFTSALSDAALASLQAKSGSSEPLIEASNILHNQQYLSSSVTISNLPAALSSRLFLRMPSTVCVDSAATASLPATSPSAGLGLDLCTGAACRVCLPSNYVPGADRATSSKSGGGGGSHTAVIIISCGVFVVATIAVVLVLFHRQFALADEDPSKEEKELATNLAYVLRI
ncbi:hypothetical protein PybrP1_007111 [[Pythium] brassicae (nom. inval.)]|nr:hypothetical protein PybrP1_007111 [[Pythium] brassicae (nom. inval.)]